VSNDWEGQRRPLIEVGAERKKRRKRKRNTRQDSQLPSSSVAGRPVQLMMVCSGYIVAAGRKRRGSGGTEPGVGAG